MVYAGSDLCRASDSGPVPYVVSLKRERPPFQDTEAPQGGRVDSARAKSGLAAALTPLWPRVALSWRATRRTRMRSPPSGTLPERGDPCGKLRGPRAAPRALWPPRGACRRARRLSSPLFGRVSSEFLSVRNARVLPVLRVPPPRCPASLLPPDRFYFFFFSHKFGKKVTYFNHLSELREHLKCDQLAIPPEVLR